MTICTSTICFCSSETIQTHTVGHINGLKNKLLCVALAQVLPPPVHQLLTHEPEEHGGPAGQLRGHPDELPGVGRHQAAAHQGHAEEAVQGDHDGAGETRPSDFRAEK